MDLTGRTLLGKYEIEGLMGRGGMGAVWRARHALTGRKLAIKTLDEAHLDNAQVVQRFGREARAASAVRHPGIVEVLDLDQTEDGIPFLVMEFLEGENLARRIERRGRIREEELVRIGVGLLEALDAAHGHGVIHRDLKPENIYVVPAGRRGELVKILDFGISHKADEAAAKLTMTGSVLGTPHYMSPEQAMGETVIDQRADVYAAGVVLYECAVGDVPFDAPNYNKLLRNILDREPVPPRRRGAEISAQVEALILWALEKERDRRVSSAKEMLRWLRAAANGEPIPWRPSTRPTADDRSRPSLPVPAEAIERPAGSLPMPHTSLAPSPLFRDTLASGPSSRPPPRPRTTPISDDLEFTDPLAPSGELELDEGALRTSSSSPPRRTSSEVEVRPSAAVSVRPVDLSPPPPPRRLPKVLAAVVLAILVLVGIVVLRSVLGPAAPEVERVDEPTPPPTADPPRREPAWVSVTVDGLPPQARLSLDGLPATSPLRLRQGGRHVLEIHAPGYEDRRMEFAADRNRTLNAELRPAEGVGQPTP